MSGQLRPHKGSETAFGNRHPVDRLALVRREKRKWEEEEERVKAIVLNQMEDAGSYGGDEYVATLVKQHRKGRIDEKLLRKAGIDVERYRGPETIVKVIRTEQRVVEEVD